MFFSSWNETQGTWFYSDLQWITVGSFEFFWYLLYSFVFFCILLYSFCILYNNLQYMIYMYKFQMSLVFPDLHLRSWRVSTLALRKQRFLASLTRVLLYKASWCKPWSSLKNRAGESITLLAGLLPSQTLLPDFWKKLPWIWLCWEETGPSVRNCAKKFSRCGWS